MKKFYMIKIGKKDFYILHHFPKKSSCKHFAYLILEKKQNCQKIAFDLVASLWCNVPKKAISIVKIRHTKKWRMQYFSH